MKQKEVEDVLGGADSWNNVDQTQSELESMLCEGATRACDPDETRTDDLC